MGLGRHGGAEELAAVAARWLASHGSENTRAAYGTDLWAFSQWCENNGRIALTATTADVTRYFEWAHDSGASGATLARRRSALTSFFDFAGATHEHENPAAEVEVEARSPSLPSATAVLSDHDAQALLRASDRLGAKTAALVRLLMLDGLRLGEVLATDISAFRATPTLGSLIVKRRERAHAVSLSQPTTRRLIEYLGRRSRGALLLSDTPGRADARLTRFGADYLLKEAARAARIAPVSANVLRRRYVGERSRAGIHIDDIRDHLGHRDVRTTRRYIENERKEPHDVKKRRSQRR